MRFWVGGYTADMDGLAAGVGVLHAGAADDALAGGSLAFTGVAAAASSPSWLAWHPQHEVIYAAQEGAGSVQAFRRTGEESFAPLGAAVAVGDSVCHLAVDARGTALVASCYGDGNVVVVTIDADGALRTAHGGEAPKDPYSGFDMNPRAPHAHQARFVPGGVVTTDLGYDTVRIWGPMDAGQPRLRQEVALPRGSGPRHTVWHPSGHLYVVTEYSNEVFVLRPGADGTWSLVAGAPIVGAQAGHDFPAEIALSRDAEYVYVGVRGSNTIATLRVSGDGGALSTRALTESGVDWPRHHLVVRDTLLVAGQRSNEVTSLTLDARTGVPGTVRRRIEVPTPTMLLADRA